MLDGVVDREPRTAGIGDAIDRGGDGAGNAVAVVLLRREMQRKRPDQDLAKQRDRNEIGGDATGLEALLDGNVLVSS
jgi:hypothetical protein